MEITVKMMPEEYDLFRGYQKEKDSLERELSADYERLRKRHEKLCKAVLDATDASERSLYAQGVPVETAKIVTVVNTEAAINARTLAEEWFS